MDGGHVRAGHAVGVTFDLMDVRANLARDGGFAHIALLYRGESEYRSGLAEFARAAVAASAPLQVAVPGSARRVALAALAGSPSEVSVSDMAEVGRNPARLIAFGQSFADEHRDRHVYCAWEPAWPGRSRAEQHEVARHEALCNLAYREEAMTVLCLYDLDNLSPELITQAELTHPTVISSGRHYASPIYLGAGLVPPSCDEPLPAVPAIPGRSMSFTDNLGSVREFCARQARAAGLSPSRVQDLILAVSEIVANSLSYAGGGVVRAWPASGEIICQIEDRGYIPDPLAGRRPRAPDALGGHGLRLVNHVCDLVERRTSPAGTITRLHMRSLG